MPQSFAPHWDVALRELLRISALRSESQAPGDLDPLAVRFGLEGRPGQRWSGLSGGEGGRALLAAVLDADPPLLLADEPAVALDVVQQWRLMALLLKRPRHCVALVVPHHLNLAERRCDQLAPLHRGRLVLHGATDAMLEDSLLDKVYSMAFNRVWGGLQLWPTDERPAPEAAEAPATTSGVSGQQR